MSSQLKVVQPQGLVIETGIPIHGITKSPLIQAFRELADAPEGASFFVPLSVCAVGGQISERAVRVGGRGWVSIRKVEGGHRAWKVGEPLRR